MGLWGGQVQRQTGAGLRVGVREPIGCSKTVSQVVLQRHRRVSFSSQLWPLPHPDLWRPGQAQGAGLGAGDGVWYTVTLKQWQVCFPSLSVSGWDWIGVLLAGGRPCGDWLVLLRRPFVSDVSGMPNTLYSSQKEGRQKTVIKPIFQMEKLRFFEMA